MIQAVLANRQHPGYGVATVPFPISKKEYGRIDFAVLPETSCQELFHQNIKALQQNSFSVAELYADCVAKVIDQNSLEKIH